VDFNKPIKLADIVMLVFLLLFINASVLGGIWWLNQRTDELQLFDSIDRPGYPNSFTAGGRIFTGASQTGWMGTGICMLGIMLLGPIMHFAFSRSGDYSGAVRLS
jgi:hypothetical protein